MCLAKILKDLDDVKVTSGVFKQSHSQLILNQLALEGWWYGVMFGLEHYACESHC